MRHDVDFELGPHGLSTEWQGVELNYDNATVIVFADEPLYNHVEVTTEDDKIMGMIPMMGSTVIRELIIAGFEVQEEAYVSEEFKDWFCETLSQNLDVELVLFNGNKL
jgi:hypothetical protein